MPAQLKGTIVERPNSDGKLTFHVKIRQDWGLVGAEPEWTRRRAERLLADTLLPAAKLKQNWRELLPEAAPPNTHPSQHTLISAATDYLDMREKRTSNASSRDAVRRPIVKHLLPYFAYFDAERQRPRLLTDVRGRLVSEFTEYKKREREELCDLADTLHELPEDVRRDPERVRAELDAGEWELLLRFGQRGGRRPLSDPDATGAVSLSSRGLADNEINRCLTLLSGIYEHANYEYELDPGLRDPCKGRRLPRVSPERFWLRPDQLEAMLDAAAELDADDVHLMGDRHEAVLVLALTGMRAAEFGGAQWRDADLSNGVLHIPESKTTAGRRGLVLHRMVMQVLERRRQALEPRGTDYVFATHLGTRRDRNNVRGRLLSRVVSRADELLAQRGQWQLPTGRSGAPRVTPHVFRRTYLSYLAWEEAPERFAMSQAGHKDAHLTLEVYQQHLPPRRDPRVRDWVDRVWSEIEERESTDGHA